MKIEQRLNTMRKARDINGYDDLDAAIKKDYLANGKAILTQLGKDMGLRSGDYSVRINPAGPAVSGDVFFRSSGLSVCISESCMGGHLCYRAEKDNSKAVPRRGNWMGNNNQAFTQEHQCTEHGWNAFVNHCVRLHAEGMSHD